MGATDLIDLALTRGQGREADVSVVIDALRATSTVAQALATGYRRVLCARDVQTALHLRGPGRVLASEQRWVAPPGFAQGNSPAEAETLRGEELVLATTNGAPATVEAASRSPRVLLASMLNLQAVARELEQTAAGTVQIVCAGIEGRFALEDVYVAGRLSALLHGPRTDAALVAEGVARSYATPADAFAASGGGTSLAAAGMAADVALCARDSILDVVPIVVATWPGVAVVDRAGRADGAPAHGRRRRLPAIRSARAPRTQPATGPDRESTVTR